MYNTLLKSRIISNCKACKLKTLKLFYAVLQVTEAVAQRCSVTKVFLNISAKLTRKHLFQSLFLIELQTTACNFIKGETLAQFLYYEFSESFKNIFFYRTPPVAASELK